MHTDTKGYVICHFQSNDGWNKNDHRPLCGPESLLQNSMNTDSVKESEGGTFNLLMEKTASKNIKSLEQESESDKMESSGINLWSSPWGQSQ